MLLFWHQLVSLRFRLNRTLLSTRSSKPNITGDVRWRILQHPERPLDRRCRYSCGNSKVAWSCMYGQRAVHFWWSWSTGSWWSEDRMLDMGFIERHQQDHRAFATKHSKPVVLCNAIDASARTSEKCNQWSRRDLSPKLTPLANARAVVGNRRIKTNKSALLSHMITDGEWDQALIFIETESTARLSW